MTFPQKSYSRVVALVILAPACLALAQSSSSKRAQFEVASLKPNKSAGSVTKLLYLEGGRFSATNASLKNLIGYAYKAQYFAISGGPAWIDSDRFDIEAKAEDSDATHAQIEAMLQSLLADRFRLTVHRETKQVAVYVILPAKKGTKLTSPGEVKCVEFRPDSPIPPPPAPGEPPFIPCGRLWGTGSQISGGKVTMSQLTETLAGIMARPVIDQTNFTGTFDVHLEFSLVGTAFRPADPDAPADTSRPTIFTALEDQLGLKLESGKGPAEILVIDHAEKPTGDQG